jgi:hypothetical protein
MNGHLPPRAFDAAARLMSRSKAPMNARSTPAAISRQAYALELSAW